MSEKLDEIIVSNAEIKQSYKTIISLLKGFIGGCSIVIVLFITFMIQTKSDIATIKATLATTENIASLKQDIEDSEKRLHNEMGVYISLVSYIAIETQKNITISDLFFDFGRSVNVKDEELEKFRTTAIFKLNNNIKLGTSRNVN